MVILCLFANTEKPPLRETFLFILRNWLRGHDTNHFVHRFRLSFRSPGNWLRGHTTSDISRAYSKLGHSRNSLSKLAKFDPAANLNETPTMSSPVCARSVAEASLY